MALKVVGRRPGRRCRAVGGHHLEVVSWLDNLSVSGALDCVEGLYRPTVVTNNWPAEFLLAGGVSTAADKLGTPAAFSLAARELRPASRPASRPPGRGGWLGRVMSPVASRVWFRDVKL